MKRESRSKRVALAVALFAGSAMVANSASAEGYGTGLFHHSEIGIRGASGHFDYGDLAANLSQAHHGTYSSGYRGYTTPISRYVSSGQIVSSTGYGVMTYRGPIGADGQPSGTLRPGMVLPDGAVVVSVGR